MKLIGPITFQRTFHVFFQFPLFHETIVLTIVIILNEDIEQNHVVSRSQLTLPNVMTMDRTNEKHDNNTVMKPIILDKVITKLPTIFTGLVKTICKI